jgi:hypothetical protein
MTEYFTEADFLAVKKQRKKVLLAYFIVLGIYLLFSVGMFLWYRTLVYQSPTITTVKLIHYSVTALFVIFSMIFLGIKFSRVNKFYHMADHLVHAMNVTFTGSFLEFDESLQYKDGVDVKSLVFIEWNKYKNDFFERRVFVFYERPFPEIPQDAQVKYVTQGNVLLRYEIL